MGLLNISIQGQPRIERVFQAIDAAMDTTEILDQAGALLLNRMRDRFLRERDPDGNQWEKSKAALHRAEIGRGGGTLYDTGRLFGSIQLYSETSTSRAIGTDVPYAPYVQFGDPNRIFLGFGEEDVELVQEFIIDRISEAINGVGS